jgi:hypothetical protein
MITVATFDTMPDAYIAKGRLEVDGIACRLLDEHLVQTDWLYAIAVGGIKLQVAEEDVERALAYLAADYSGELDD